MHRWAVSGRVAATTTVAAAAVAAAAGSVWGDAAANAPACELLEATYLQTYHEIPKHVLTKPISQVRRFCVTTQPSAATTPPLQQTPANDPSLPPSVRLP